MKGNKKLTIVISIVLALAVTGGILAYLYLMTDTFRSKKELFGKYLAQNEEVIQKTFGLEVLKALNDLENQNKYTSDIDVKMIHSEGGEISNPLNGLSGSLNIQKNDEEQYMYMNGQILYEDEEYLQTEIIKQKEQYGIRFTDAVKQFITIKNDENIELVATDLGINAGQIQKIIDFIDGNSEIIGNENYNTLKDKYLNIITKTIANGNFEKQKDAMITYNKVTTKTNAYSVQVSSEQVGNMLIEILNNLKSENELLNLIFDEETAITIIDELINKINNEFEIPTIKITVFEKKQQTIRTDFEIGLYKISLENVEQEGEIKTKINYSDLNNEQLIQYNFEITKKNIDNQEEFIININVTQGEENYSITISNNMKLSENKIEIDTEIDHKKDITSTAMQLKNVIKTGSDFEKTESLVPRGYIILNALESQKRKELIDLLNQIVPQKINERTELLKEKIGLKKQEEQVTSNSENENTDSEISQVEINKFNAKFEFYTGEEVTAENVKMLLNVVKNNLHNYEIFDIQSGEDETNAETKINMKLYIKQDETNEQGMTKILETIDDNKKYKVLIVYKETNGLIDYITINEI